MTQTFHPELSLLIKLGSIVVHLQEFISPNGHPFDKATAEALLQDADVQKWLKDMDDLALLPKKR